MEVESVLVEREDRTEKSVYGSSGIMLNNKYVITTANILSNIVDSEMAKKLETLKPGRLYPELSLNSGTTLNVVWKTHSELYTVKKSRVFSVFISEHIKNSSKRIFEGWAIDSIDNNRKLNDFLSVFLVLSFDQASSLEDFKSTLKQWWYLTGHLTVSKGDQVYVKSTPFGNRNFLNSYGKGIVSNIFGNNSCFMLSDCSSTPGSEGSPVYLSKKLSSNPEVPIGIILSSLHWWKGEWVGLTLLSDIRPVILELIDTSVETINIDKKVDNQQLLATTEFSLVQVYSGQNWGTAILVSYEKGIFITNSHVIDARTTKLFHKNKKWDAELVYKTPDDDIFDLAVVKCDPRAIEDVNLKSIPISNMNIQLGGCVYSAGFPLFSKDCQPTPTLTMGCVSQTNPYLLKTTCCIQAGASGGAILDAGGALLGVIVCNIKLHDNGVVYPRVNMAVPISAVGDVVLNYVETEDPSVLKALNTHHKEAHIVWKRLEGKL